MVWPPTTHQDVQDAVAALQTGKQDTATLPADVASHVADGSALDTALRAAFVPFGSTAFASNPTRVILDQARLDSSSSTQVSGGSIGRAYSLADAANTWVGGTIDFPADWHTVNVDAWVAPLAAATGNVVLQFGSLVLTDGSLTTANATTVASVTVPLPAVAFTLKVVRIAASVAVDPSGPMYLRCLRLGNDANDTSTQNITVVRMDVTKAS